MSRRYVYRVCVDGAAVRHYQSITAARHRAVQLSTRRDLAGEPVNEGKLVTVERSLPVQFEHENGFVQLAGAYQNGAAL